MGYSEAFFSGRLLENGTSVLLSEDDLCNSTVNPCTDMQENDRGKSTAIALIRMVVSILSILGTASIILSVLIKRQVRSSKVHPIFVLSIADFLLAVLWVIGGALWLVGVDSNRVWCFTATLLTVIMECVSINLTLVYALYAHAHIKHMNLSSLISNYFNPTHGWSKWKVALVYILAWFLPTVLVMIPFSFVAGLTKILPNANKCSCQCVPKFPNVLPYPSQADQTSPYMHDIALLDLSFGVVIATHYVIVFPLLVLFYCRVLRFIKRLRKDHEGNTASPLYGATEALIVRGQSQAKHRVSMFLTVFVVTGFCNLVLACFLTVLLSLVLSQTDIQHKHTIHTILTVTLIIQSITVPLQGFLNAIVYGWTREDFLYIMASTSRNNPLKDPQINNIDIRATRRNEGILSDLDSSLCESDQDHMINRYSRQGTPETNLSGAW